MAIDRDVRFELLARLCPNTTGWHADSQWDNAASVSRSSACKCQFVCVCVQGAECRSVCTEAGMYAIRARRKSISEPQAATGPAFLMHVCCARHL